MKFFCSEAIVRDLQPDDIDIQILGSTVRYDGHIKFAILTSTLHTLNLISIKFPTYTFGNGITCSDTRQNKIFGFELVIHGYYHFVFRCHLLLCKIVAIKKLTIVFFFT